MAGQIIGVRYTRSEGAHQAGRPPARCAGRPARAAHTLSVSHPKRGTFSQVGRTERVGLAQVVLVNQRAQLLAPGGELRLQRCQLLLLPHLLVRAVVVALARLDYVVVAALRAPPPSAELPPGFLLPVTSRPYRCKRRSDHTATGDTDGGSHQACSDEVCGRGG